MTTITDEPIVRPSSKEDEDWAILIGFEEEQTCEVNYEDCSNPPTKRIKISCCNWGANFCQHHVDREFETMKMLGAFQCRNCKTLNPELIVVPI